METKDHLTSLQKVPVVAFEEGLRLGRVHDVYVDKRAKRIRGVSFRSGLWSKEKDAYVDLADILKIGKDVIIVSNQAAAVTLSEELADSSLRHLKGVKITTHEGAYIGELVDLNVNREDGRITEILMTDNQSLKVDPEDIVLGPDVILVPTHYVERIVHMEAGKNGVLTRMLGPAAVTESLRDKYEEFKASVGSGKGTEKMFETLRSGSEKTRETVIRTSRKIQETLGQMRQRREQEETTGTKEEGEPYQGVEAEHAGRTYVARDDDQLSEPSYQGPYAEEEEGTDRGPGSEERRE